MNGLIFVFKPVLNSLQYCSNVVIPDDSFYLKYQSIPRFSAHGCPPNHCISISMDVGNKPRIDNQLIIGSQANVNRIYLYTHYSIFLYVFFTL